MRENFLLPQEIAKYHLVREVLSEKKNTFFKYGLYQDALGNRGFAKVWVPNVFHSGYKTVSKEIRVYKWIWDVLGTHPSIRSTFPNIRIPRVLHCEQGKRSNLLLLEFIDGTPLRRFPLQKRKEIFETVLNYCGFVSDEAGETQLAKLPQRSILHWLGILPIVYLLALFRRPKIFHWITLGFFICMCYASFSFRHKRTFVLRDMSEWNILISDDVIWIIDFELACAGLPIGDMAAANMAVWERIYRKKSSYRESCLLRGNRGGLLAVASVQLAVVNLAFWSGKSNDVSETFLKYSIHKWTKGMFQRRSQY